MTPENDNAIRAACRRRTEEEFHTLAAELSRRLEQMAVEAEKNEGGAA
ncbi:hypothetical protein ABK735_24850 [Enterobacter kobei]